MTEADPGGADPAPQPTPWHTRTSSDVAAELEVDLTVGLHERDIDARRERFGRNAVPEPPKKHPLLAFFSQFADPLVGALLVAAVVAASVAASGQEGASWPDTIAILLIVLLNAALGFYQERRAETALSALRKLSAPRAKVLRDGELKDVDAASLVPGDVIDLESGAAVPADSRVFEAVDFAVSEAPLTGESVPVDKDTEPNELDTTLADRSSMVFSGTTVARGHARAIVVGTGVDTEIGRIGKLISEAKRTPTPLEQRLARLGRAILVACLLISALVFVIGLIRGTGSISVLLLVAVSLAVAAIPEGLPAITTITLALGMQRMAKRGAIVRKLPAVETLGSATIICSDKTGTLTQNAMTVRIVQTAEERFDVTGEGYDFAGRLEKDGKPVETLSTPLEHLLKVSALCNTTTFQEEDGERRVVGDPDRGRAAGAGTESRPRADGAPSRKREGGGAPLRQRPQAHERGGRGSGGRARLPGEGRTRRDPRALHPRIHERWGHAARRPVARAAARGRRGARGAVLPHPRAGRAHGTFGRGPGERTDLPRFRRHVRPASPRSERSRRRLPSRRRGRDHDHRRPQAAPPWPSPGTSGIWDEEALALTGTELADLSDEELAEVAADVRVFARVTAEQKLRIVQALSALGHVVAMTGDGVNDAPALREAPIGVAMGKTGTDVARQAAEMVLADDNFATIVEAIREGRAIFRRHPQVHLLLGKRQRGAGPRRVRRLASSTRCPPLTPLMLLWINLVTNGLPALALGIDPAEPGQMSRGPRPPGQGIVGWRDLLGVLLVGAIMCCAALSVYVFIHLSPGVFAGLTHEARSLEARTMTFMILALSPLFHAFNCRSPTESIFSVGWMTNRFLWLAIGVSGALQIATVMLSETRAIFITEALGAAQWLMVLGLSALPVPIVELFKLGDRLRRRLRSRRGLSPREAGWPAKGSRPR